MWQETIKLGFGNSLLIGFSSPKITLERIANKMAQEKRLDLESFGLFDSTSPNYTTYYPEVTAEDLVPKDSEFIEPVFRALSEVIVHKTWNPVDFSMNGALKKSKSLLKGATINPDHESFMVGNAIGAVSAVSWQDEYETEDGFKIPAGINAILKIDGKSNPRIARGIMMDPPSIHSTSVTVNYMWDKSHALTEQDFFAKLGTFEKDGKMVRKVANRIIKYPELSLVHHGADPFAQKHNPDGVIVNPRYADVSYNAEQAIKHKKESKLFFFDYRTELLKNTIPLESNDNKTEIMDQLLLALATALGMTGANHTQETVMAELNARTARLTELQTANTALTAAATTNQTEITRLKALEEELVALKAQKPDTAKLTELEAFQTSTLSGARGKVVALYTKTKSNKPDAAILTMINTADLAALAALETQYNNDLELMFPSTCKKCGSKDITKASAKPQEEEKVHTEKSADETVNSLMSKKRKEGSISLYPGKK